MKKVSLFVTMGLASTALFSCKNSDTNKNSADKTAEQNKENFGKKAQADFSALFEGVNMNPDHANSTINYQLKCGNDADFGPAQDTNLDAGISITKPDCTIKLNKVTVAHAGNTDHINTFAVEGNNHLYFRVKNDATLSPATNAGAETQFASGSYNYTAHGQVAELKHFVILRNNSTNNQPKTYKTPSLVNSENAFNINDKNNVKIDLLKSAAN